MNRYLITFILALFLSIDIVHPKTVGLVMSGGGAKGLYHVGVLEALEESGVPIDYVAGTSMGAIVAALYASGYTTQQMRELANSGQLESWAVGKLDKNYGSYFRSGSTLLNQSAPLSLKIDMTKKSGGEGDQNVRDAKMKIPRSVISTVPLDMAITELFSPATVASGGDFSKLMVPFLCVASDVTNNQMVLFTQGDLGLAVRASMAIPLAYKPVVDERGHMLYDGGIQDNFPWRSMVDEFAPDLIIGSTCSVDKWADTSDMSLLDQALFITMNVSDYDLPENGIKIARDVPIGLLDFSDPNKVMDYGYWDTKEHIDSILAQIPEERLRSVDQITARREEFLRSCPELKFDSYDITGLNEQQKSHATKYMATTPRERRRGADLQREMDFGQLKRSLFTILSSGDYDTSFPVLSYSPQSQSYKFQIEMEHRPVLKLSIGGNISSTPFNQIYIGASHTKIGHVARTLFSELYLGPLYNTGRIGYRADFYHSAPMFIDAYVNFAVKNLNHGSFGHLTEVDNTRSVKGSDSYASLGVGVPIRRHSMATLRVNCGVEDFDYDPTLPTTSIPGVAEYTFDRTKLSYTAAKFELERNTIDNPSLPNGGSRYSLSAIGVLARESSYAQKTITTDGVSNVSAVNEKYEASRIWVGAKGSVMKYFNFDRHKSFTVGVSGDVVLTNVPDMYNTTARQLIMPAYQPLAHMQQINMPEYSAARYVGAGVMPNVRLWRDLSLRTAAYAMLRDDSDVAMGFDEWDWDLRVNYLFQASLAYESPIGAVTLSATKYGIETPNDLYLTFNFGFTIFSPRGTYY